MLCKICDVRDWSTAEGCAQLGAEYLGLHAIWEVKPERLNPYIEIVTKLTESYPQTKTVAVTRQQDVLKVVRIVESIRPSAVQLHAAWTASSIMDLREKLGAVGLDRIRIIGVVASSEQELERVADIREAIDFLLLDRTLYEAPSDKFSVTAQQFLGAKKVVHPVPVFLAGGLTPENVGEHIAEMQPDGVDVQTGVEYLGRRGVKDFERVAAFIRAARA